MSDLITPLDEIELEVVRIGAEVRAAKLFQRLIATIDQYRARLRQQSEPLPIDGKFGWMNGRIVNLVSREPIPTDEPLFLLRARDQHALEAIYAYQTACRSDCNNLHKAGIQTVRDRFTEFAKAYPERMKQPGKTRHLKL